MGWQNMMMRLFLINRNQIKSRPRTWLGMQARDGRVLAADYPQIASKPGAGVVDASVEVGKGLKFAAGCAFPWLLRWHLGEEGGALLPCGCTTCAGTLAA